MEQSDNMKNFLKLVVDEPLETHLRRKDRFENRDKYLSCSKIALKVFMKLKDNNLPKESVGIDLDELDLLFKGRVKEISIDNLNKINTFLYEKFL